MVLSAACATGLVGCGGGSSDPAGPGTAASEQSSPASFESFKVSVPKTADGIYIVEGDIQLGTDAQLRTYFDEVNGASTDTADAGSPTPRSKLIVSTRRDQPAGGGAWQTVDNIWSLETRKQLSYCVDNAFGTNKALVVNALNVAARAWENAANVHFIYKPQEDYGCNEWNVNVLFSVRPTVGQSYLGSAFLPSRDADISNNRSSRVLNLNSTAFTSYTPLLRTVQHELGHVLGFRHEWLVQNPTCTGETLGDGRVVTPNDAASIMSYPSCNGGVSINSLTSLDNQGATQLYGAPTLPTSAFPSTEVLLKSNKTGKYVCSNAANIYSCGATYGSWERFKFFQNADGTVSLMAMVNTKYVTAAATLSARADVIDTWEKYILITNSDGTISLKSLYNDKYVTIPSTTADQLAAAASTIDTWEKFTLTQVSGAQAIDSNFLAQQSKVVWIQAVKNGKYWSDYSNQIQATAKDPNSWEKFIITPNADGTISFWSQVNSRFFTVSLFTDWIQSTAKTIDAWEKFTYVNNADGTVSFKSVKNNKYVTAPLGYDALNAGAQSIDSWEKFRIYTN
ncbi:hypothetical protein BH11PSE7_BH11PSE7_09850 [soil metagenome]